MSLLVEAGKFVFVDERATYLNMHRDYAWSLEGSRAHVHKDKRQGKHVSLLAAMFLEGIMASLLVEGSVDTDVFIHYVRDSLCPTLKLGQIVIMDNCQIHLSDTIRTAIESAGASLWFLPPYSPDLSPIENAFSKLKSILKSLAATCLDSLSLAVRQAFDAISLQDILAWFDLCGYPTHSF